MAQTRYDVAETLVYDPIASNRNATRAALRSLGFHSAEFVGSLDSLRAVLAERSPDLVLCEVGGAEQEVCALVQSIRQGKIGNNPFVVIIATTWRRDGSIVSLAVNCGADDLLARPFSAAQLGERLKIHIERRKDFVVTSDYIGPDRRHDQARAGGPCLVVPNSLRIKTSLGLSSGDADQRIAAALEEGKRIVNDEKLRRDGHQLSAQWHIAQQRQPGGRDFAAAINRIESLSTEIARRAEGVLPATAESAAAMLRAVKLVYDAVASESGEAANQLTIALQVAGEGVRALEQALIPPDGKGASAIDGKFPQPELRSIAAARAAPGQAAASNRLAVAALR